MNTTRETKYATAKEERLIRARNRARNAFDFFIGKGHKRLTALVYTANVLNCYGYCPAVVNDALRCI